MVSRRWALFAGIAALVVLVLVAVLLVPRILEHDEAASPAAASSPAPTWDMTAQPVPNEHGSLGQFGPSDVAERFVVANYAWSPDVPEPAGRLAGIRDWTTDALFASAVDAAGYPDQWEELHEQYPTRKITVLDVVTSRGTDVTVTYRVVDVASDGSEREGMTHSIALRVAGQPVYVDEGDARREITETRVDEVYPDSTW